MLLDGDLQDPPELIEQFVAHWREGYDVVYGRRVKREATLFMQFAYKAFYRVFDYFSYVPIPHDAGDFSLMDKRVVQAMLQFPERDLFLRGVRAFAGFKQTGVDYVRPERMFGRSTNNLLKNIGWAKKGILSFSNTPLNIMSVRGGVLSGAERAPGDRSRSSAGCSSPSSSRPGFTTTLLLILFFGSLNFFGDQHPRRVPRQGLRGGQAAAPLHPPERDPRRRGASGNRRSWPIRAIDARHGRTSCPPPQSVGPPGRSLAASPVQADQDSRPDRWAAAARRFLDLQAGSIWRDLSRAASPSAAGWSSMSAAAPSPTDPWFIRMPPIKGSTTPMHRSTSAIAMPDTIYYEGDRWPVADALGRCRPLHRDPGARPRSRRSSWPRRSAA